VRLAFITYEYPPETAVGGIGTYTKQVSCLLAQANYDVYVFAGSHTRTAKCLENGITIQRIKCTGPEDFRDKVVAYFEREHCSNPFQLIESAEIHANAIGIKEKFPWLPLSVRLHASNWLVESFKKKYLPVANKGRYFLGALKRGRWDLGYWRRYLYKKDPDFLFLQLADFISAPTMEMKNWVVDNWKIDPAQISVVDNPFADNNAFNTAITANEEHVIIYYGRLNVLKGLITATKAMRRILKKNPGWQWIIVGDDGTAADGKSSMKEWMKRELMGVLDQVSFYEAVPYGEIPGFLSRASIVLVPSLFESYSYVTIEAMSAGKAIIGSANTGISSLIKPDINGLLADPYKPAEWKNAIQHLIDDLVLRQTLGKAAIKHVEDKYRLNCRIVEYYQCIASKGTT
jgi:glycosyltransferase involved in cell wall biosynthesis